MKVYSVDLDGVLDKKENVKKINKLFEDPQNYIVIHTARSKSIRKETEEFLFKHQIKYHALVMEKMRADYYIDDKNLKL